MKKTKMLKKNYEFKRVLSKGKCYSGKQIEAFINKNNEKNQNLLGIAISVKVAKAIERNRIKRLIREAYRDFEENLKTSNSIVFLWKKKIMPKEATYENIKQDMKNIFEKAKIFVEE